MALGTAWAMRRCGSVVVAVDRFLAESTQWTLNLELRVFFFISIGETSVLQVFYKIDL